MISQPRTVQGAHSYIRSSLLPPLITGLTITCPSRATWINKFDVPPASPQSHIGICVVLGLSRLDDHPSLPILSAPNPHTDPECTVLISDRFISPARVGEELHRSLPDCTKSSSHSRNMDIGVMRPACMISLRGSAKIKERKVSVVLEYNGSPLLLSTRYTNGWD